MAFEVGLSSNQLNEQNWVYDFGNFNFLKEWLQNNFDHKLILAQDDPELEELVKLDQVSPILSSCQK